jgi:membrane protease YdiL (CAAX protease family)
LSVIRELWSEIAQLLVAGAIVASIALPIGFVAFVLAKRSARPFLPNWKPWRCPWGCFEVVATFLVISIFIPYMILFMLSLPAELSSNGEHASKFPPFEAIASIAGIPAAVATQEQAETAATIRGLWAGVIALPLQLSILLGVSRILYPSWRFATRRRLASQIALAVLAWFALTPLVHVLNMTVNILFTVLDWPRDSHQLTKLAGQGPLNSALLVCQACIAAPIIEEIIFRGVILAWIIGGRKPYPIPDVPSKLRPWLVALAGVFFAATSGRNGAFIFSASLVIGLGGVSLLFPRKKRTIGAIYSSAALFAAIHSSVWPSPIPLFLLGLGLGWLAARTRGIVVPAIVHGLFNAVATVIVLRSAGG